MADIFGPTDRFAPIVPEPIVPVPEDAPACTWRHPEHGAPAAIWAYRDAEGRLVGYAARVEFVGKDGRPKKDVLPLTYCKIGHANGRAICAWRAHGLSAPRPLYNLPELLANPAAPIVFCEGEKKADMVPKLFPGYVGTTSMGGAQSAAKSDWTPFAGRCVIGWPDNDEPGRRYAADVARRATAAGAVSVAVVAVPRHWPESWDLADPPPDGVTPATLARLLAEAAPWEAPEPGQQQQNNPVDDDAQIARLKALKPLAYEREREVAAKRLGIRVGILDRLVKAKEGKGGAAPGQGRPLDLPEPEPWLDPVDGAELIDEIASAIRRYVVLRPHEADAVALWVLAVHAFDAWHIFPRLFVTAPEPRCGKTTLLDVLWHLVPKPLGASNVTAASIFRIIEAARPTFLLDEADAWARDNEDLRSVIDGGHKRDGSVIRTVGDNHESRQFSTWAPIALAAIGNLARTIADRSITIRMRRRRRDETIESLRHGRTGRLDTLARKAARWGAIMPQHSPPRIRPCRTAFTTARPITGIRSLPSPTRPVEYGPPALGKPQRLSPATVPTTTTSRCGCCCSATCASCSRPSRAASFSPRQFSPRCTSATIGLGPSMERPASR
jgi:hypothetical protein